MVSCEMCGKEVSSLKSAVVAGSSVNVCTSCSAMGSMKDKSPDRAHSFMRRKKEDADFEVADNYAQIIQSGINSKKITPQHVARGVNLKESSLSHYLKSQIKPDIATCRRLENFLDIKLVFEVSSSSSVDVEDYKVSQEDNDSALSLGDMLLAKMKK